MIGLWGANGFIGRHTAQLFIKKSAQIKLFSRGFSGFPIGGIDPDLLHCCDFKETYEYWDSLKECKTLVLMVSASNARTFHDDILKERQENFTPHHDLLERIDTQENNIEQIIYLSSGGTVYGDMGAQAATEDDTVNPISPYGRVKLEVENEIIRRSVNAKWAYTILRVANPVGYWNNNKGIVSALLNAIKNDKEFSIYGDGCAVRDYFDVRDLARAIYICTQNEKAQNHIFNIGSGAGLAIKDIVSLTEQALARKAKINFIKSVDTDVDYNVLNCDKAQSIMQWSAQTSIDKTIKDMWEYI